MDNAFILKVLSGPHLGAEVSLAAGEYRIGRDADCDIVLTDRSLAAEHALVVVGPDGLRVQPLAGEVLINRQLHEDAARLLPFFTMLAFGTTVVTVGPEAGDWPLLTPPLPGIASEEAAGPPPAEAGPPRGIEVAPLDAPLVPGEQKPLPVPRHGRSLSARQITVFSLILIALAALPLGGRLGQQTPLSAEGETNGADGREAADPAALIRARLIELGQASRLTVEPDGNGQWQVRGYVESAAERQAAQAGLDELDLPIRYAIHADEQLEAAARDILVALGRRLDQVSVEAGVLTLGGFIPEASDLQRAVDIVGRDVTGLRAIRNEVFTERAMLDAMRRRLAEENLAGSVRLDLDRGELVARGRVSSERAEEWEALFAAFDQEYGRFGIPLVSQVMRVVDETAAPEQVQLDIRAAGGFDGQSWVMLADGQKYLVGSIVADGWRIERIDPDAVHLSRAGRRYTHAL